MHFSTLSLSLAFAYFAAAEPIPRCHHTKTVTTTVTKGAVTTTKQIAREFPPAWDTIYWNVCTTTKTVTNTLTLTPTASSKATSTSKVSSTSSKATSASNASSTSSKPTVSPTSQMSSPTSNPSLPSKTSSSKASSSMASSSRTSAAPTTSALPSLTATFPATYANVDIDTSTIPITTPVTTHTAAVVSLGSLLYTSPLQAVTPQPTNVVAYGVPNEDGSYLIADVTYTAHPDSLIVNIEDIEAYISSMTCGVNAISVVFEDSAAFAVAKEEWTSPFTLVTSGASFCGAADGDRTFYTVSEATVSGTTISLTVAQTDFQTGVQSLTVNWGSYTPSVSKRVDWSNIGDDIVQWLLGQEVSSVSGSTTLDVSLVNFGYIPDIEVDSLSDETAGTLILSHDGSGTFGSVTLSGSITLQGEAVTNCWVELATHNLEAVLDMQLSIGATSYQYEKTLASYALDGFSIGSYFSIGPTILLKAGVNFTSQTVLELSNVGFTATIPDNSITLDLTGQSASSPSAWEADTTALTPSFSYAGVNVDMEVYIAPAVSLGLTIANKDIGSIETDLQFPQLTTSMTSYPENQCANGVTTFNNLIFQFYIGLKLFSTAALGSLWSGEFDIYSNTWPIGPEICVAF